MYLAFWVGKVGIFGKLIRLWTGHKVSHVELIIDGEWFTALTERGVVRYLNEPSANWRLIHIPLTADQKQAMLAFLSNEIGSKYDWLGIIFSQVLPLARSHSDKWFCSELVTAALHRANLYHNLSSLSSPGQLFDTVVKDHPVVATLKKD